MNVAVIGATGHTGRFIIEDLVARGFSTVAVGRSAQRLRAFEQRGIETRVATANDPLSLDAALHDVSVVVNAAGPFLDTAQPVIQTALRRRVHYFDITAEQMSAKETLDAFDGPARARDILVVPAAGFYGALGDVLATVAIGEWSEVEELEIAVALDRWWPTDGTRRTGARNTFPRVRFEGGALRPIVPGVEKDWVFSAPFGTQRVVELPFTETILASRHVLARRMRSYLNERALRDVRDPETPPPVAADDSGRSAQQFIVEARAIRSSGESRSALAKGRDIYAVTAPIVGSALEQLRQGSVGARGARAFAEVFDARRVLNALTPSGVEIESA